MLCDYKGSLGDAIRISKIYSYLKSKNYEVTICNLREYYTPKSKLVKYPKIVAGIISDTLILKNPLNTKYNVYIKLGKKVLGKQIQKVKPEVVLAETVVPGYIAIKTCSEFNIPTIVDIHGIKSAEYKENPYISISEKHLDYLNEIEKHVFKNSNNLIVVSNPMKEYIIKNYKINKKKIIVISNGADIQKRKAKYTKPLKVIYAGIFAFWENIDSYVDLAKLNKSEFFIAGSGPLEKYIKQRIKNEKIPIIWKGYLNRKDTLKLFSKMSVGVAPSLNILTRNVACPIKVFDYMSYGLPVITPNYGEWARIIAKNNCGIVTKESDAEEFNEGLKLLEDKKTWEEFSKNCILLIKKKYNWNVLISPLEKILKKY